MPQTRPNKMKTIVNADGYNLSSDLATMADSANVTIPVANQTERDGLAALMGTLLVPTVVYRADLNAYESWNGSTWDRVAVTTNGAGVTDGFWTISGGMVKTVTNGLTMVTASMHLTRVTAPITINTTDTALLIGFIPAGLRPSVNHYFPSTANTNVGARYAEPQLVIGDSTNGTLVGRSISGGPVTIGVGYVLFVQTSWVL